MIKKGNKVIILSGKDKKKEGEVIEIDRSNNRAKVKGINIIKKHVKTTKEKKGGIIEKVEYSAYTKQTIYFNLIFLIDIVIKWRVNIIF